MWKFLVVLCVLFAVCVVDARRSGNRRQGGRGRGGRRGVPAEATNIVRWVRTLPGENAQAQELAYSLGDRVFVISKDKRVLRNVGFKSAQSIYDFTDGTTVRLLKMKKNCYLMNVPQGLTKETLLSELAAFDGQTREESPTVDMYPTALSPEESATLQNRSELTTLCSSRKPIVALSSAQPANFSSGAKTLKGSALESFITINIESRRGGRKGGRRGGRRNRQ